MRTHAYEVSVTIGRAFAWDEIEPQVLQVLGAMQGCAEIKMLPPIRQYVEAE